MPAKEERLLKVEHGHGEAEAASLLNLRPHQLRDVGLKGLVEASVGPRGKFMDSRCNLLAYLAARRWGPS
jgi:hypothetical protein